MELNQKRENEAGIVLEKKTNFCKVEKYGNVDGSGSRTILIDGKSHTLLQVNGGSKFTVKGTGHKLENCKADKLVKGEECIQEMKNCNFTLISADFSRRHGVEGVVGQVDANEDEI